MGEVSKVEAMWRTPVMESSRMLPKGMSEWNTPAKRDMMDEERPRRP